MRLIPLNDQVIVRRAQPKSTTPGGLVIPATAQDQERFAEVVAVGRGRVTDSGELVEPQIRKGDTVLLRAWFPQNEVKVDGETLLVVREDDIVAFVDDPPVS